MEKEALPKVLIMTKTVWNPSSDDVTLMDIFRCWDKDRIAQIYTKTDLPDTEVCQSFFQINENLVMKSVLCRSTKTGRRVYNTKAEELSSEEKKDKEIEKERYDKGRKKNSWFLRIARDLVWFFGKWRTREFDEFIDEEKPDVLFFPILNAIYFASIEKYIAKKTGKPYVLFFTDDFYTYKACTKNPLYRIHRFFHRRSLKKLIKGASKILVISPKQKEEYDKLFKRDTEVFTRGIDPSTIQEPREEYSFPTKIVYSGNTFQGRDKSIILLAKEIDEHNKKAGRTEIILSIYSGDSWNTKFISEIGKCKDSKYVGFVEPSRLAKIQSEADVLLFVESLKRNDYCMSRLSFSTKITDYLKASRAILAIGPRDIAPVDYLAQNDGAIICSSQKELHEKISLLTDRETLRKYSLASGKLGLDNHSLEKQKGILFSSLIGATEEK